MIAYFGVIAAGLFVSRNPFEEREKGQVLSAELAEVHAKLKEITIVKERTRIAQEMHDSIGHSLIALRMHLEFAENMIHAKPDQAGDALSKSPSFFANINQGAPGKLFQF